MSCMYSHLSGQRAEALFEQRDGEIRTARAAGKRLREEDRAEPVGDVETADRASLSGRAADRGDGTARSRRPAALRPAGRACRCAGGCRRSTGWRESSTRRRPGIVVAEPLQLRATSPEVTVERYDRRVALDGGYARLVATPLQTGGTAANSARDARPPPATTCCRSRRAQPHLKSRREKIARRRSAERAM